ncbi:MAG: histidine kinase, partial [Caldilineaceae bacterium]
TQAVRMRGVSLDITERVRVAADLARYEQRLRLIANSARVGMWEWNGGATVIHNRPMGELFGSAPYDADETEVPLAEANRYIVAEDLAENQKVLAALVASGGGELYDEVRVQAPGRPQRVVAVNARVQVDPVSGAAKAIGISYDVTQQWELSRLREQARAELEQRVIERTQDLALAYRHLREETAQRLTAEEHLAEIRRLIGRGHDLERVRLAHELHDGPMQELAALSVELSLLAARLKEIDPSQEAATLTLRNRVREVALNLRSFAGDLRPPVLDSFGVSSAIAAHVDQMLERHPDVAVTLDLPDEDLHLEEAIQTTVYRVFQQALYNVYQHANATQVHVRLTFAEAKVMLRVEDNGVGFRVPDSWVELARSGHLGIVGMSERAAGVGGHAHVTSTPGQGTRVEAVFPLVPPA